MFWEHSPYSTIIASDWLRAELSCGWRKKKIKESSCFLFRMVEFVSECFAAVRRLWTGFLVDLYILGSWWDRVELVFIHSRCDCTGDHSVYSQLAVVIKRVLLLLIYTSVSVHSKQLLFLVFLRVALLAEKKRVWVSFYCCCCSQMFMSNKMLSGLRSSSVVCLTVLGVDILFCIAHIDISWHVFCVDCYARVYSLLRLYRLLIEFHDFIFV